MVAPAKVERRDVGSLLEKGHRKMDKKKVREAIEVIKGYRRLDEYMNNTERLPYCDMAIEALEKQLPKEIKAIDPERSEEFGDVEFCCPNCNSHYLCDIADVPNYCPECGIRFDT